MLILLSPAKTFSKIPIPINRFYLFPDKTDHLVTKLKKLSVKSIEKHMKVSKDIATHVHTYYETFGETTYEALSLYDGQAFKGLNYMSLDEKTKAYANHHLLIMDALYGLIHPKDGISKYRLDMLDKVAGSLYPYWKKTINTYLKEKQQLIINLSSYEFGKILDLDLPMITIDFRQKQKDSIKSISMHTKLARGMMARHLLMHPIEAFDDLIKIEMDGYQFEPSLSDERTYIFIKTI